ncbi:hypothetical protein ACP6EK_02950 [Candidatus Caldatribacterium sp. SIUC1]|uniref:hypothetical protein n=1 Tax=Candidatus Caldatribacterium sp. SIUC1 TaxID=3418365 RepID=UPI003F68EB16
MDYEISRIPDEERRYRVFLLAPVARTRQKVNRPVQVRAQELERLGFKALDALHIACAEAGGVRVLLTTDDRTLNTAQKIRGDLRVRVANPVLWLMEVTTGGSAEDDASRDSGERLWARWEWPASCSSAQEEVVTTLGTVRNGLEG